MPRRKKEIGYDNIFPKRLQNLLDHQKNMTQGKLAKIIGVDRTTIGKWIAGTSCPDAIALTAIAKTFNVSTDWLLFENAPKKINPKLASICEYTGLTEHAVEKLHEYNASFGNILNVLNDFILSSNFDSLSLPVLQLEATLNGWKFTKNILDGKINDLQNFSKSSRLYVSLEFYSWVKSQSNNKKAELTVGMIDRILQSMELYKFRTVKCLESFIFERYKDSESEMKRYDSKFMDEIHSDEILRDQILRSVDPIFILQYTKEGGINNGEHNETKK